MQRRSPGLRPALRTLAIALAIAAPGAAQPVTFNNDTTIACGDPTYTGYDVTVNGATLTIDCQQTFNSLTLVNGAVVARTPKPVLTCVKLTAHDGDEPHPWYFVPLDDRRLR